MISSAVMVAGCGGGGGTSVNDPAGSTPAGDDNSQAATDSSMPDDTTGNASPAPEVNLYSGSSSISGAIALSSLAGADAASVKSASYAKPTITTRSILGSTRAADEAAANAVIKLFAVTANGELEDTGLACQFDEETDANGNPKYSCEGIADGKNYVVKYLRLLADNRALEMKVSVEVPEGAAKADAEDASPQSTLIVDTIVNAILSATEGKEIDKDIVEEIIGSVKEVVGGLIQSGTVQVPSMVVEAPKDKHGEFISDIAKLQKDEEVVFDTNDNLDSAAGTLLSSEEVSKEVDAVKVEIEVREIKNVETDTDEGKKRLVAKVFDKLLDGDVPDFMVNFFADKYIEGLAVDVETLFSAIEAGLEIRTDEGFDLAELDLDVEGATAALQALLKEIYRLEGLKSANALTDDDKEMLADIPGIIPAIFPAVDWAGVEIGADTKFDIPQSIVFTIFLTDKYVPDAFEEKFGEVLASHVSVDDSGENSMEVEHESPVDFNPMVFDESGDHPGLLQLFGFFEEQHLAALDGYEISHLDVMPEKAWIVDKSGVGREHDMLRANVCVTDIGAMARMVDGGSEGSELSVALEYPVRGGGRQAIELLSEHELFGPMVGDGYVETPDGLEFKEFDSPETLEPQMDACFTLDPWAVAQMENGNSSTMGPQISEDDIVSDFVSGEYKVIVKDDSGNVVAKREFKKKVITGMAYVAPQITSPNGMPQWPEECNFSPNGCPQWDEAMKKWTEAGGNTTFPLNADSESGAGDRAKVTISWKKPEIDLPDGVKIGYSMDVILNGLCDEEGCKWENIYSTWEDDKRLFGTSFTLPRLLEKLEVQDGRYNVNVCAEFIDTDNGEYLGAGGCGFAEFNVGEPLDTAAEFSIEGEAPAGLEGQWKVALIAERSAANPDKAQPYAPERETVVVSEIDADGRYFLKPNIGDFLLPEMGTNFNIVMFEDLDGNGEFDNGGSESEPHHYPDWRSHFWFETGGQMLRVVSEEQTEDGVYDRREAVITGGETVEGPNFDYLSDEPRFGEDDDVQPPVDEGEFYEPQPGEAESYPYPPEGEPAAGGDYPYDSEDGSNPPYEPQPGEADLYPYPPEGDEYPQDPESDLQTSEPEPAPM